MRERKGTRLEKGGLFGAALGIVVALLALVSFGSSVECNIAGTPVACPFDFNSTLSEVCMPSLLNSSVKVEINYPGNFTLDSSGTYLAGGGTLYREYRKDGNVLFFAAPKISSGSFSTYVTINGVTANTTSSLTVSACPCILQSKGFSVKYDETSGRQILQGAVSGSTGCPTDGSVVYKAILFISRGTSQIEAVASTSTGDYIESYSIGTYSAEDALSFRVAVTDATTGTIYGFFSPEVLKPNDFSMKLDGSLPIQLSSGTRTDVRVNITNRGSLTEYYEIGFENLPEGWQTASTTTRALSPGESGVFQIAISPTESPLTANATLQARSSISAKTKEINVTFSVAKTVSVSSEIYTSVATVPAGEEFDVTALLRVSGSVPEEKIYWIVVSEPVAKLGANSYGKMSAFGTQTFYNKTYIQKLVCKGSSNLKRAWLILKAVVENPEKADQISSQISRYGNGTGLETDISNFATSKNKTVAANTLISKIENAEQKALSNCTASEGTVSLSVFAVSTLNGAAFESQKTQVAISGKSGSFYIESAGENVSIPKGGAGNATFRVVSNFPSEKQVSLKVGGTTSFKVEFPGGASAKVPPKGTFEFNVSISDKGTIVKTSAEPVRIDATTTDITGEPITSSDSVYVVVRSALLELTNPLSTQTKVEQGMNRTIELKFRNTGTETETFTFSPAGPVSIRPDKLEILPGKTGSVNMTIAISDETVEGSKMPAGVTGKSVTTGEDALFKTDVLVISSEKARLKKNIDGLLDESGKLAATCRYYSLSKLNTLLDTAKKRLDNGEMPMAKSYYDMARAEFSTAEIKCEKPDTAATLFVIGGIAIVGGAIYYFAFYRKKPPQKKSGYIGSDYQQSYPAYYNENQAPQQQQQRQYPPR